jgi:hypothetical protein
MAEDKVGIEGCIGFAGSRTAITLGLSRDAFGILGIKSHLHGIAVGQSGAWVKENLKIDGEMIRDDG